MLMVSSLLSEFHVTWHFGVNCAFFVSICNKISRCQKRPLAKVFYACQVWLYNLTVVCQTHDNTQSKTDVSIYTWLETETGRVPMRLHGYLSKLESSLCGKNGLTLRDA